MLWSKIHIILLSFICNAVFSVLHLTGTARIFLIEKHSFHFPSECQLPSWSRGLCFVKIQQQSCFYRSMSKKSTEAIYWSWCLPDKPGKLCSLQTRSKNILCWTGQWSEHSIAPCCLVPLECHQHLPWSKGTQKAQSYPSCLLLKKKGVEK